MTQFQIKQKQIEACQWFKNGDHPQDYASDFHSYQNGRFVSIPASHRQAHDWEGEVVRRFNHPDSQYNNSVCARCNHPMHQHGFIDQPESIEYVVCPGDWIVSEAGEVGFSIYDNEAFHKIFEPIYQKEASTSQLGHIYFRTDDDTGMYRIGEVDGGFDNSEILKQYITRYGVTEILTTLAYMQHQAISMQHLIHQQTENKPGQNTRDALINLAEAVEKDNKEHPARKGDL